MRPVLKKTSSHNQDSIMLVFKSMEITVRAEGERRYPPLFVPMNIVRRAYEIP
jgi:hypothetical protein